MGVRWGWVLVMVMCALVGSPAQAEGCPGLYITSDVDGTPNLHYSLPEGATNARLLRSTSDLASFRDELRFPIASVELDLAESFYKDVRAPQGVEVFYLIEVVTDKGFHDSQVASVWIPEPRVGILNKPHLMVDKLSYTMLLMDGDRVARRLPIALGANPTKRKLHFDRASTPEGVYKIVNLQPQAYYHKAFDINYPNGVDKSRYHMSDKLGLLGSPRPDIGGEIQIHGGGIDQNWTWGCIALRDLDMDWLFARPELKQGVQVAIAGSELQFDDLQAIAGTTAEERRRYLSALRELGLADNVTFGAALGRFQYQSRLPVTTQLDIRTRELLEKYTKVGVR
jgi:L,D-transpeptidase-like protein